MKNRNNGVRAIALLLALSIAVALAVPALALDTGEAVSGETIYIDTVQDLLGLAEQCTLDTWSQGKTVQLRADLSLAHTGFQPIPTFGGVFEGNGHTISGLDLHDGATPAGLFGVLQQTAVVRNLHVSGSVTPSGKGGSAGGLVGENYGQVLGCSFSGTVSDEANTGGIAGINAASGLIENCQSSGAIFGENRTGGIAGYNLGTIRDCANHAYINIASVDPSLELDELNLDFVLTLSGLSNLDTSTAAMDTGGIAGYSAGIVQDSTNDAAVGYQHIGYNVGGIVGRSSGYIVGCENSADVYGRKDVGGIAGHIEPYIILHLSESTLSTLQRQLEELSAMIDQTLETADAGVGSVANRLNRISDYADSAADAASNITTQGSVSSSLVGGAAGVEAGGVSVTPPQAQAGGSGSVETGLDVELSPPSAGVDAGAALEGELSAGLSPGSVEQAAGAAAGAFADAAAQISVTTSVQGLSAAVGGMTGQMRLLGSEMAGLSGTLKQELCAISDQVDAISETVYTAVEEYGKSDSVQDTSGQDVQAATLGKTALSTNRGAVYGDINVGGIAGTMALEYELDPEDDVSSDLSAEERRSYEWKAILYGCVNEGTVLAKRSFAGGACGRMDLGLITDCENYGDLESEGGDYVGGIAGYTSATIRSSFAKCSLRGGRYIGGIVGSGTGGDAPSTVAGCYSLVSIPAYEQYAGAIAGVDAGNFEENYFVSETLAGINRASYAGKAEPVSYTQLVSGAAALLEAVDGGQEQDAARHSVPEAFCTLTLRFVVDGKTVKTVPFQYGESFDASVYPELPEKQGYYAYWDRTELENLCFDTQVNAVYVPYVTALGSTETRTNASPIFFAEGQFDDSAVLSVAAQASTPSAFDALPDGFWETLGKCFSGKTLSREIVEQWLLTIPEDGRQSHTLRYLSPDRDPEHLDVYVRQGGGWNKVETRIVGSYLCFEALGSSVEVAVISTMPVWWVWLIVAALALALLVLAACLLRKAARRRAARRQAAAEQAAAAQQTAPPDTQTEPAPGGMQPKKPRRWLFGLLLVLALLLGFAAAAACFLLPDLKTEARAYQLLKKYEARSEIRMELSVQTQLDGTETSLDAFVSRTEADGTRITCVESGDACLYYADGAVYLENGKAFRVGEAYPDYLQLLQLARQLYQDADVSESSRSGQELYTISVRGEAAGQLFTLLAPELVDALSDAQGMTVELSAEDGALCALRFSAEGTLEDAARTPFAVNAQLSVLPDGQKCTVPQCVLDAIAQGDAAAADLTQELLVLFSAWDALQRQDPMQLELALSVDCGPIVLDDQCTLYRTQSGGSSISVLEKKDSRLYFTENAVCDESGRRLSGQEASAADAGKLLGFAYELCMQADFSCRVNGTERVYSIALDEAGMREVACAIAPAIRDMDTVFETGHLQITLEDGALQSVCIDCSGTLQVLHSGVPVCVGAKMEPVAAPEALQLPDAVIVALRDAQEHK